MDIHRYMIVLSLGKHSHASFVPSVQCCSLYNAKMNLMEDTVICIFLQATRRFFSKELGDRLSPWDCLDLMNLWFILIVISDCCAIIGSLMKTLIDVNVNELSSFLCF